MHTASRPMSIRNFSQFERSVEFNRDPAQTHKYSTTKNGFRQERHLDAEKEVRRNAERQERAALVDEFKIGVSSSPFRRPVVLQSPRLIHEKHINSVHNIDIDAPDKAAANAVDKRLQIGLLGTGVFQAGDLSHASCEEKQTRSPSYLQKGTSHHLQNNQKKKGLKSKLYSGQLYRGALAPSAARWGT